MKHLLVFALLLAGCLPLRPDVLEPSLREVLLDPVKLAELCGAEPSAIGTPSQSRLTVTAIENQTNFDGSGAGTALATYKPLGDALAGKTCSSRIAFEFDDSGGAKVTAGTIRIHRLRVLGGSSDED